MSQNQNTEVQQTIKFCQSLFSSFPLPVFLIKDFKSIIFYNQPFQKFFPTSLPENHKLDFHQLFPLQEQQNLLKSIIHEYGVFDGELELHHSQEEKKQIHLWGSTLLLSGKEKDAYTLWMIQDVTRQNRINLAVDFILQGTLRASEGKKDFFEILTKQLVLSLEVPYAFVTRKINETTAYVLGSWTDKGFQKDFTLSIEQEPCREVYEGKEVIISKNFGQFCPHSVLKDWLKCESYMGVPLKGFQGEVLGHIGLLHTHSTTSWEEKIHILRLLALWAGKELEQIIREEMLMKSEKNYRFLLEKAPMGVLHIDKDGNILHVNQRMLQILGSPSEEDTKRFNLFIYKPLQEAGISQDLKEVFNHGEEKISEYPYKTHWGKEIRMRCHVTPLKIGDKVDSALVLVEDFTIFRKMEEQMRTKEKLAALGQLASGVAHDFNNLLQGILGYAELIGNQPNLPEISKKDVAKIQNLAHKGASLISQILDYARQSASEKVKINLYNYLKEQIKMLEKILPESILISFSCRGKDYWIHGDPVQLDQIFTNLMLNARDAMQNKGKITINLNQVEKDQTLWVVCSISDTGEGIPPENLSKIFDPFFTTKPKGKGTGLGLAQVMGLVKKHEGMIEVASEPGKGTTFYLYFPKINEREEDFSSDHPKNKVYIPGQGQRIAVVEDDVEVLAMIQNALRRIGYQPTGFENPQEALDALQKKDKEYSLLLTDLTMPHLNGDELIRELRKAGVSIPAIAMTGYPLRSEITEDFQSEVLDIIKKPVTLEDLAKAVSKALESSESS